MSDGAVLEISFKSEERENRATSLAAHPVISSHFAPTSATSIAIRNKKLIPPADGETGSGYYLL